MNTNISEPRVAVVTGGSRGIGRKCVERLAADGHRVVVSYASQVGEAEAAVEAASVAGGQAIAVQAEVADADGVAALFERADRVRRPRRGRPRGREDGAGAAGRARPGRARRSPPDQRPRHVRRRPRGRPPDSGRRQHRQLLDLGRRPGFPTYSAYSAGKGAVEAMTPIMARELRGRDVTVNAVAPGPTATALFLDDKDEATIQKLAAQPPLERLGTSEDIAEVVAFLAGPQGHWVNGQVVRANGGIV